MCNRYKTILLFTGYNIISFSELLLMRNSYSYEIILHYFQSVKK